MKLSKKQRAMVLNITLADINRADDFYESKVEPLLQERQKVYTASKEYYRQKFPKLSEQSDIVSYDMWSTVQWAKAPILSAFFGGDEIVNIVGREAEDADRGVKMKKLIEFQLLKQNSGFVKFGQWIDDAMALEIGVVKAWWKRETEEDERTELLPPYRLEEMASDPKIEIVSVSDPDEFGDLVVKYKVVTVTVNQPVVELVRPTDLRWTPGARTLEEANFVAQKKVVTADHLRRMANQGTYDRKAVVAAIDAGDDPDYSIIDIDINPELEDKDDSEDPARRRLELYECYTKIDVDEDGLLEDVIATVCGGQLLRVTENHYGQIPFFVLSPNKDPYKVIPDLGFSEVIGELQHLKTAMLRQVVVNLALNNQPRNYVDDVKVNMDDLLGDRQYVRVHGNPNQAIYTQAIQPIAAWTMPFFEYIETLLEQWTGRTRYNQGLDAKSLNKMLALDTPIPLIDGTVKLNGDIVEGDIVVGSNGKGTKVLKAHPIQMPERAFEIEFQTGDVIKAGGEHRWTVQMKDRSGRLSGRWEKLPTERIYDLIRTGHKAYIPRVERPDFTEKDLPIDPYVLGLWLGDGHSHTNRFTTKDPEVVAAFEKWSRQFYKGGIEECASQNSGRAATYQLLNTPFRKMAKDLGIMRDSRYDDMKDNRKHIPDLYLRGSFDQRVALLRGLMDTDGCIDKNGNAIFCNSEPALVETFMRLVESFGCKASVNWRTLHDTKFKNPRPHAHVIFSVPFCPVSLPAKVSRWRTSEKFWEKQRIVSIKEIPIEPMRCLTVAAEDELYCCGRKMTLTSNTASGMNMIMKASTQRLGQIIRQFAETGVGELYRFLIKLNQKYITQDQVIRLMNEPIEISLDDLSGRLDIDVNIDIGIGEKQQTIQNLQLFLGMLFPQGQAMGVLTPREWINAARKIMSESGIRNINDYVPSPEQYEQKQQQQVMQRQMMGPMGPMNGGGPDGPVPGGTAPGGNPAGPGGGMLKGMPPALAGIASQQFGA